MVLAISDKFEELEELHQRYRSQLDWTKNTRNFIYRKLNFSDSKHFLEIGCGTGALLEEIAMRFIAPKYGQNQDVRLCGVDIDKDCVEFTREYLIDMLHCLDLKKTDASKIPFGDGTFDVVVCHYFLMWNDGKKRKKILQECRRVLKDKGWFVCFSEPDYGGRIDEPETPLKEYLISSLQSAGADPFSGRKLFADLAEFNNVQVDCCSTPWTSQNWKQHFYNEWNFYKRVIDEKIASPKELEKIRKQEINAIESGGKFTFMPVFYGYGQK